jgi:two-component system, sensor histidine kinase PdtaS
MRTIGIILFLIIFASANGQSISAIETVKNYSVAQKRLLAISTAQFANSITQNNLDKDSVMILACRITCMPFLLPYNEGFGDEKSESTDFINAGKIYEAVRLLRKSVGEKKIRILIELATWYLHQPGTHKKDLDSAEVYLEAASKQNTAGNYLKWQNECLFLIAQLHYQRGNISDSKKTLVQIASSSHDEGNMKTMARACHQLGELLPNSDSMKLVYYQKSVELYQQLQLKEKEIELLGDISNCHMVSDVNLMEQDNRRILSLQQSTGFRHILYAQHDLSKALLNQAKNVDALSSESAAMENMRWSGISAVQGSFYYRTGIIYELLGKNEEALSWFIKALDSGTKDTHLFWYKSLFFVPPLLLQMNKARECLSMIIAVTGTYPPLSQWEKMQVLACKGSCYGELNQPKLADSNYMALLQMARENPNADPQAELSGTYFEIGDYYISQKDPKKARLFLKQGLAGPITDPGSKAEKYSLLFRMDSLEGKYKAALENHIKYKLQNDSVNEMDQRKKMDELIVKYAAEKKDQDIKLLKEQGIVQQAELKQNMLTRNIMIAGTALLLIIVGLLFSQFKLKQRTNAAMNKKNLTLQHLVEEKEWLLKEVHHRVKNNLHTVICLLESQAAYLENDALKAIENSQHRIYAMSLIHQKLYQSEDVKTIDMSVYLPEFIRYLDESFGAHYNINFHLDIEPLKLGVSQAIPIALIINEAVTNSIKYAFQLESKGIIEITMHKVADKITLMIADNGIGIDASFANESLGTFGLKLIKGLTQEINGSLAIINDHGTKISIVFNLDPLNDGDIILTKTNEKQLFL